MEFLVSWLADYVDLPRGFVLEQDPNRRHSMNELLDETREAISDLRELLTSVGLAVEGDSIHMDGEDQEVVLDVEVTSNRPDCMNHLGLAREIAVKRRTPLRPPVFHLLKAFRPTVRGLRYRSTTPRVAHASPRG